MRLVGLAMSLLFLSMPIAHAQNPADALKGIANIIEQQKMANPNQSSHPQTGTRSTSSSPSFDCEKASSPTEKLICANDGLSTLDSQLSKSYSSLRTTVPDPERLKLDQREWIKNTRNLCMDVACLTQAYEARIQAFAVLAKGTVEPQVVKTAAIEQKPNEVAAQLPTTATVASSSLPNDVKASTTETTQASATVMPTAPESGHKPTEAVEQKPSEVATLKPTTATVAAASPPNDVKATGEDSISWGERLKKIITICAIAAVIGLFCAGMTGHVVIFYDWKDFRTSLYIFFSGIGGLIISLFFKEDPMVQNIVLSISALAVIFFSIQTIRLSIVHNRNVVIGAIVGVLKIFLALFSVVFVWGKLKEAFGQSSSIRTRFFAVAVLGIFAWFLKQLINGERVYAKKGWNNLSTAGAV